MLSHFLSLCQAEVVMRLKMQFRPSLRLFSRRCNFRFSLFLQHEHSGINQYLFHDLFNRKLTLFPNFSHAHTFNLTTTVRPVFLFVLWTVFSLCKCGHMTKQLNRGNLLNLITVLVYSKVVSMLYDILALYVFISINCCDKEFY